MSDRNRISIEPNSPLIVASRVFDAPRDLVFSVWTDPKHLAQWWGPNGFTTTTHSYDCKPGGVWRFVMHGPDGRDYQNRVTFHEVVKPERLVYSHDNGEDVEPIQFKVTVTFADLDGRTRLDMRMDFPSAAARDEVIKISGADKGLEQTLARLADYLPTLARKRA